MREQSRHMSRSWLRSAWYTVVIGARRRAVAWAAGRRRRADEGRGRARQQTEDDVEKSRDDGGPIAPFEIGMCILARAKRGGDGGQVHRMAAERC